MKTSLIELKDISYVYADGTKALEHINLTIKKGKKIAIMGPNGSGKSTLFLLLTGILKPQTGQFLYQGTPVKYNKKGLLELRSKVGIVFQDPDNQLFSANVYQEISFGPMNLGWERSVVDDAVNQVIGQMEITPFKDKATHFLSGGQKKQVSIADIIVMSPEVIIMDEPTAALDFKHSEIVRTIINKLCDSGVTVLIATHDSDYALEWADELILFKDGQITKEGSPTKLFRDVELCNNTNQTIPKVLSIYNTLMEKGILKNKECIPKSLEELARML
jgi:cobalt transport protein ATP-binding subunit